MYILWGRLEAALYCAPTCAGGFAWPHLPLAELEHLGQSFSFRRREILLGLKLLLQLDGLVIGEANLPPFPLVQRPLDEGTPEQGLPFKRDTIPAR